MNTVSHGMVIRKGNQLPTTSQSQECIDLDTNGRRWEGGVKDGKPFGYGVLYDEEGRKEYEGFMFNESKTCYGIEYYSDIGNVKYDGCFCNGNRFGRGILYNRNGMIDHDGLWKNNKPYSSSFDGITIDTHTESIDIPNKSFSKSNTFILQSFTHSLKRIVIGDECFVVVHLFELDGLNELESIVIGGDSFRIGGKYDAYTGNSERTNDVCRIVNCPKLKSIQIGYYSFTGYRSFELNNLPSLQSIDLCGWCFHRAPSFSLIGLMDWVH